MGGLWLGKDKPLLPRLCFGCCPMGGHGWGEVNRNQVIAAVHCAMDREVSFFDTADIYGLGESERILGEALKTSRENAVIATKFGVRIGSDGKAFYDNSPQWIQQAVYDSLTRLNTDYIDLYQIHYRDGITPISAVMDTLLSLREKGVIRAIGLSNISENDIAALLPYKEYFFSFQNEYSLANRTHEKSIQHIEKALDSVPMTWGSLGQGILTGKYTADTKFDANDRRSRTSYPNFHGEKLVKNLAIVDVLRKIGKELDKAPSIIAIRWILDFLPSSIVIIGIKSPQQFIENSSALGWELPQYYIDMLNTISVE